MGEQMTYDFDSLVDRRNQGSLKWDVGEKELPMWVADMDFQAAPAIRAALEKRVAHGVFGYSVVPDEWYNAYTGWWEKRHGFRMEREWLIFCTGVVPAISSIVRRLTCVGEKVLVQTPVYNIFFNSIVNNGRKPVECPLSYDGTEYSIDFAELERQLSDPQTRLMLLCNPQNPVGKIWDREILARIGELCAKHSVIVVSDEIHCDLTIPGREYVPFASVSEICKNNSVTCLAPTKTFNIAGLQTAAVSIPNPALRSCVDRGLNNDEVAEPNVFAVCAAVAAFTEGGDWLDALRGYLFESRQRVKEFLEKELPCIRLVPGDATYLLWLDCSAVTEDTEQFAEEIRRKTGLYLSAGGQYGKGGERFLRMNIACPHSVVEDGLHRLKAACEAHGTHGQVIMRDGVPFSVDISDKLVTRDSLSEAEFDAMMSTGLAQAKRDDSVSVEEAFKRLKTGM